MTTDELYKIVRTYLSTRMELRKKLPYCLNLLDELHANENAHTRILIKLLAFEQNGQKIFLEKFLQIINKELFNNNDKDEKFKIDYSKEDFKIYEQYSYIDCYIVSSNYAIIVENKINGARDRWEQIKKYIETTQNKKYSNNKIYVVYLTNDGSKTVSNESFTIDAKKYVDYDDVNYGRFIPLNYRNHILPILQGSLKEQGVKSEKRLETALFQYIDYLKGRFSMREEEKMYYKDICTELKAIMPLKNNIDEKSFYEEIKKIKNDLNSFLDKIKIEPFQEKAERIKDHFNNDNYFPFSGLEIYNEEEFPIVVFKTFKFEDDDYKLDIMIDLDGFLLTFKYMQPDKKTEPINQTIKEILNKNDFAEESLTKRIESNDFDKLYQVINDLLHGLVKLIPQ